MTDRQLELFIIAASCKSFSKAANKSYVSVSSLVQQIDALEKDLGFELFIRNNRGISLSENGKKFHEAATKILEIYNSTIEECKKLYKIKIAIAPEQIPDFLLKACKTFNIDYPDCKIELIAKPYNEHLNAIENLECDCSIIAEPSKKFLKDLHFIPLYKDTYSFMVPFQHPLASKEIIELSDLNNCTIICGYYPYLKYTFENGLKESNAKIMHSHDEYNFQLKADNIFSQNIMVFHTLWKESHKNILKVVPSSIPAGDIGIVCKQKSIINSFLPYIKQAIKDVNS